MSQRFVAFLRRVARESEFKQLQNALRDWLIEEAERKHVNYPRFVNFLRDRWAAIGNSSELAKLLYDNYQEVFRSWLTVMLPYRKGGLSMANAEAPTAVDFKLDFEYKFSAKEVEAMERVVKEMGLDDLTPRAVSVRLFIVSIMALGPTVADIVEKPFSFQIANREVIDADDGGITIKVTMSGREQ
ncbi:MAG: hypothetical protein Kow0069_06570 [Promethearchaeota archaeon]